MLGAISVDERTTACRLLLESIQSRTQVYLTHWSTHDPQGSPLSLLPLLQSRALLLIAGARTAGRVVGNLPLLNSLAS